MKKLFSIVSNLQIHYHFKLDIQKVDQHTGGKWYHGTTHRKDNHVITNLLEIEWQKVNSTGTVEFMYHIKLCQLARHLFRLVKGNATRHGFRHNFVFD